jgi:hypothetical protein
MLPARIASAVVSFTDFDALAEKSPAIRSGVSCSSRIRSATRWYPRRRQATTAPATKKLGIPSAYRDLPRWCKMTGTPPWAGEDRQFLALAASHSDRRCRLLLLNSDNFGRKGKAEALVFMSAHAAAAPPASSSISDHHLATNFAAWSLTSAKSLPAKARQIVASGSADHKCGADLYFETLPAKRRKAQSALAVLQADNRNTVAMRSGPSCSSMIVSERRMYLSDFAATEAPAEKVLENIPMEMRDGASDGQVNIRFAPPSATLPSHSLMERKARGAQ